ncbi:TetR/AcrR family transcriptional regulator [Mumia quercus]|uniref:TetR/AcrR family transcriptional regulator n=1 Tax=Mumia quercus TaxID=2976125 RepID=UPI0021CFD14B|nr:TetR/AcrR family transcriptional regulator [Mumia quercus]
MPRIQAPTVAEHRRRQERAILDATRALLAETGHAPSFSAVAKRAGMARPSVYQYFPSRDALLTAVVADVLPDWSRRVHERVQAAATPGERVWEYVAANLDLFASSEQAVARALSAVVEPAVLQAPMERFHAELQEPLVVALRDLGEPYPAEMAELVNSLIVQASASFGRGPTEDADAHGVPSPLPYDEARAMLQRLLGPYLGLSGKP